MRTWFLKHPSVAVVLLAIAYAFFCGRMVGHLVERGDLWVLWFLIDLAASFWLLNRLKTWWART